MIEEIRNSGEGLGCGFFLFLCSIKYSNTMKAHIIAIIAASLLFAGCNRGPTETQQDNAHFAYQLDWNNAGIDVSLTLTHP
ncbi:MAG: hypothetical protein IJK78_12210, partial [Bacteroidales bacterium]|nr:hypothetical protein [Bacteroidales bacterium]